MKLTIASAIVSAGLIASICNAQTPTGSTGECKDGTYTAAPSKRGACSGHGGVKDWYESAAPTKATPATKAPTAATAPQPPAAAAPTTTTAMPPGKASTATAAATGGGLGQVWVNTKSKVYHCQGDRYYGKTKQGEYMTESAAKAAGDRPAHGKACS